MKKPTNKQERDALIKELQEMKFDLPTRWDEMERLKGYYVDEDCKLVCVHCNVQNVLRNVFPTSEQAEASIYLAMLLQLRDVYREGWTPDWGDDECKWRYCVELTVIGWEINEYNQYPIPFSFQNHKRAELFLENFGDYLEKVKPLFI